MNWYGISSSVKVKISKLENHHKKQMLNIFFTKSRKSTRRRRRRRTVGRNGYGKCPGKSVSSSCVIGFFQFTYWLHHGGDFRDCYKYGGFWILLKDHIFKHTHSLCMWLKTKYELYLCFNQSKCFDAHVMQCFQPLNSRRITGPKIYCLIFIFCEA